MYEGEEWECRADGMGGGEKGAESREGGGEVGEGGGAVLERLVEDGGREGPLLAECLNHATAIWKPPKKLRPRNICML